MAARIPTCEDEFDDGSLSCDSARARILARIEPVGGRERLALRSALGRVLASDLESPVDVPQHTNSAMDGYAVRAADLPAAGEARLALVGSAYAGRPYAGKVEPGQAVRIMTGAALPAGADTVVMQEHATLADGQVVLEPGHRLGQHVRAAGEDLARGQRVLPAGRRLGPAELGLIASLGIGEVTVRRRIRIACLSTGDELRSIGQPLGPGDIYDSNRYTLYGMLVRHGAEIVDLGVVPDDRAAVKAALAEAASMADAVVTTGGVSVGDADYIKDVLGELGQVDFWKVAMKPGRPLAFGLLRGAHFFGLPGNPVSVMVTFHQFVAPALERLAGAEPRPPLTVRARTLERLRKRPGRVEFQRGLLERGGDGMLAVRATGEQGSGILHSMAEADCFIVLPLDCGDVAAGEMVAVQPFHGLL